MLKLVKLQHGKPVTNPERYGSEKYQIILRPDYSTVEFVMLLYVCATLTLTKISEQIKIVIQCFFTLIFLLSQLKFK